MMARMKQTKQQKKRDIRKKIAAAHAVEVTNQKKKQSGTGV